MANSRRKCPNCKTYNKPEEGLLIKNSLYCNLECAVSYGKKNAPKAKVKQERDDRRATRKRKHDLDRQSLKWQHKQTQISFNRMRVLQELKWFKDNGIEPYCISCQKTNMDWCCGHFKTRGSQSNLRYDERNAFLQCNRYCNMGLSGNISGNKNTIGYTEGLKFRFGDKALQIIKYCETNTKPKKWTWQELEENRKQYNATIRELEKELGI